MSKNKFMLQLSNEFDQLDPIFIESSLDLTDYHNHFDFLDKVLIKLEFSENMEFFWLHGKIEIYNITNESVFIKEEEILKQLEG